MERNLEHCCQMGLLIHVSFLHKSGSLHIGEFPWLPGYQSHDRFPFTFLYFQIWLSPPASLAHSSVDWRFISKGLVSVGNRGQGACFIVLLPVSISSPPFPWS